MSSDIRLAQDITDTMCSESTTVCSSQDRRHTQVIDTMIGAPTETGNGSLDCNMNQVTQLSSHISLVRCLQEDTDLSEQQIAACVEDGLAQISSSSSSTGNHFHQQQHHHQQQQQQQQSAAMTGTESSGECVKGMFASTQAGGHCDYARGHCGSFPDTSPTGSSESGSRSGSNKDQGMNVVQFVEQCYQGTNRYSEQR